MPKISNIQSLLCHWSMRNNKDCYILTWDENDIGHSKHFRFPWQREIFKKRLIETDSSSEAMIPVLKNIFKR